MAEAAAAVQAAVAAGAVRAGDVTPELLAAHLYTRVRPPAASAVFDRSRRAPA
jgi:undecaprenyl pyrophosphate synthase